METIDTHSSNKYDSGLLIICNTVIYLYSFIDFSLAHSIIQESLQDILLVLSIILTIKKLKAVYKNKRDAILNSMKTFFIKYHQKLVFTVMILAALALWIMSKITTDDILKVAAFLAVYGYFTRNKAPKKTTKV